MEITILTSQDLEKFKTELITELRQFIKPAVLPPRDIKWHKAAEIKSILKISEGTLRKLRINQQIRASKLSGHWYYDLESLKRHLEKETG